MSHYFITGTDTDAGKTYVTCLLLEALKRTGKHAAGFKPFVCGSRDDAIHLANASREGLTVEEVNPVWFKVPAAPYAAALMENRRFELNDVIANFQELAQTHEHVLVEGAGGWEVPLNDFSTMADKLGCLNHTILTVRNIQARGLTCAGVILNYVKDERDAASISNRMALEHFLDVPVLAEIMHGETEIDWPL